MRVISGSCRGRKLAEPQGMDVRPTTDMVKEALFNIIQFDIEGRRVLDMFAGTGQLGIEALSRGAAACVFLDRSRDSVRLVKENLRRCGLNAEVIQCDAIEYLRPGRTFDLIFVDPPYDSGLAEEAVRAVVSFDILSKGGIIICESRADTPVPDLPEGWGSIKSYRYGKTRLIMMTRGSN